MVEKFRIKVLTPKAEEYFEKTKNREKGMIVKKISDIPLIFEFTMIRPRFAPKNFLKFVSKEAIEISITQNLRPLVIHKDYKLEVDNE